LISTFGLGFRPRFFPEWVGVGAGLGVGADAEDAFVAGSHTLNSFSQFWIVLMGTMTKTRLAPVCFRKMSQKAAAYRKMSQLINYEQK